MEDRHRHEARGGDDGALEAAAVRGRALDARRADARAVAIAEAVSAVAGAIAVVAFTVFASISAVVVGVIAVAMFFWLIVRVWVAHAPS